MKGATPASALEEKPEAAQSLTTEVYSGDRRTTAQIQGPHRQDLIRIRQAHICISLDIIVCHEP